VRAVIGEGPVAVSELPPNQPPDCCDLGYGTCSHCSSGASMTHYDSRQFKLMLQRLVAFEMKSISLGQLVSGLEALNSALQEVDTYWSTAFLAQWSVLEDVHADALDREINDIPVSLLERPLEAIERLLSSALQKFEWVGDGPQ